MYHWHAEYELDAANTDKNGHLESYDLLYWIYQAFQISLKHDWDKYLIDIKMHPKYIWSGTQTVLPINN